MFFTVLSFFPAAAAAAFMFGAMFFKPTGAGAKRKAKSC